MTLPCMYQLFNLTIGDNFSLSLFRNNETILLVYREIVTKDIVSILVDEAASIREYT